VKAFTVAFGNLHEWLEVSKQWGNRALPIIACYWYPWLVSLLWAQRNAFHLLSEHTMLLGLSCFFQESWNDEMFQCAIVCCGCFFFSLHRVLYVADKWLHRPPPLLDLGRSTGASISLFAYSGKSRLVRESKRERERMVALALGRVLCSITVHIPDHSAASTGETMRPQWKKGAPDSSLTTSSSKWPFRPLLWKMPGRQTITEVSDVPHSHYPFILTWMWCHFSCTCIIHTCKLNFLWPQLEFLKSLGKNAKFCP